jgi:hypothetical protein
MDTGQMQELLLVLAPNGSAFPLHAGYFCLQ